MTTTASLPPQFDCPGCRDRMRLSDQCGECLLCRRGCCRCRDEERLAPDGDYYTVAVMAVDASLAGIPDTTDVQRYVLRDLTRAASALANQCGKFSESELRVIDAANVLLRRVRSRRKNVGGT